jgi:hypothetical protein
LLKCWKDINPDNLHKKALIFFCIQAWPQYPFGDQEKWPKGGTLNYNTILQLLALQEGGQWIEIPYMQLFFLLKEHPQTLTMVRNNTPKEGVPQRQRKTPSFHPREMRMATQPPRLPCHLTKWSSAATLQPVPEWKPERFLRVGQPPGQNPCPLQINRP